MRKLPLVSIITPCYNGESYISRYLDSILAQTYNNIELIIINDGSTDKTGTIIKSYKDKFEKKGYEFIYIEQENKGQSEAINQGLKIFKGDYLTWPDSDDYLTEDAIEIKVNTLEIHREYGLCICKTKVVEEYTNNFLGIQERIKPEDEYDSLFIDLILGRNIYYSPGGYMVRSSMFRNVMSKPIQIESPKEIGQNFQLLLPITYNYKCYYIDKILYYYTVRLNSHSRQKHSYNEQIRIIDIAHNVLLNICKNTVRSNTEMQFCRKLIYERTINSYINTMIAFRKNTKLNFCIENSKKYNIYLNKRYIYALKHISFYRIYKMIMKIIRIIR